MSGVFSRRSAPPKPAPTPAPPPEADPSMEDILASIRRILNEGDGEAPAETADQLVAAEAPPAAVTAEVPPVPETVVEPTHAATEPPSVAVSAPTEEVHAVAPEKETQTASLPVNEPIEGEDVFVLDQAMMVADTAVASPAADEAPIASNETMAAASQSVSALKKALTERHAQVYRAQATSLEEIVREEVRPMLKGWLDAHLPSIVERLVRTEIERVVAREML
jgi:cell pole-organizing protein PopZ